MGIFVEVTCTLQSTARQWLHAAKQSLMRNNVKMFVTFNPSAARVFQLATKSILLSNIALPIYVVYKRATAWKFHAIATAISPMPF